MSCEKESPSVVSTSILPLQYIKNCLSSSLYLLRLFGSHLTTGAREHQMDEAGITSQNFRCLGLDIEFPFQPYGIQKSMMGKVCGTLINKEHSLIESPTGTGKTLVLLCSALAWQKKSKLMGQPFISARLKKVINEERRERIRNRPCQCGRRPNKSELDELKEAKENAKKGDKAEFLKEYPVEIDKSSNNYINDNQGGSERKKIKIEDTLAVKTSPYFGKVNEVVTIDDSDEDSDVIHIIEDDEKKVNEFKENFTAKSKEIDTSDKPLCRACMAIEAEEKFTELFGEDTSQDGDAFINSKMRTRIPRIYYGTRTHKQITQVIRELNKTPYKKDLRMCILSSRERTCINDQVKDEPGRNDLCRDLIKSKSSDMHGSRKKKSSESEGCPFYKDSTSVGQVFETINIEYDSAAWDIEDAAKFGKDTLSCPYFGLRSLQEQADITFSPYNYLLDPTIRKNLNINLSNAIVILDEAHNIEDICRESASFNIDTKQIQDILDTIQAASTHLLQGSDVMNSYAFFRDKLLYLKDYLMKYQFSPHKSNSYQDSNDFLERKILNQDEMACVLQTIGLASDQLTEVKANLKALRGDEDETGEKKKDDTNQSALSFDQLQFITQLSITLDFMYSSNSKHFNDFRAVITKTLVRETNNRFKNKSMNRSNNQIEEGDRHLWHFSLLCMNSGVAFEKLHSLAWSVIVASGTLSPIESLKSELGCKFSSVFEGAHVIQGERIFASVVAHGPKKIDLNCAYSNSLKLEFQDEVGHVVKDICTTVPHGILCFFPSYDRMENLYKRWLSKKIIQEIQKSGKLLFFERKNQTAQQFEKDLASYHDHAKKSGAVLFAVFRGKVSEGIDFADEAARAVITIGIPYPAIKDVTVNLKKEYNDIARNQKPYLMTGGDWYASQAFRALNQALGRCIRHKSDWGAVIMIDSRLGWKNSIANISKWLRRNLTVADDYSIMHNCLKDFIEQRSNE